MREYSLSDEERFLYIFCVEISVKRIMCMYPYYGEINVKSKGLLISVAITKMHLCGVAKIARRI